MRKKGKDLSACRQGFGLIANVTVFGLALVALLAGAAFWFYVVSYDRASMWGGCFLANELWQLTTSSPLVVRRPYPMEITSTPLLLIDIYVASHSQWRQSTCRVRDLLDAPTLWPCVLSVKSLWPYRTFVMCGRAGRCRWAATILVNIIGSRIQGDADFMDEDNKDEVMLQTA